MRDLTQGPVSGHILAMAVPIAIGLIVQTLYYLVDLYFIGQIGPAALAGAGAAGNVMFLIIAFTQILGVGTVALVSHAAGKKEREQANLVFNQSILIAGLFGLATLFMIYRFADEYVTEIGAGEETMRAGQDYLRWIAPGMALQFVTAVMGSALRGTGIVRPTMVVQLLSVLVNIILAPVLIAGWGTGRALGVAGAGLATSLSVAFAVVALWFYFQKFERFVSFDGRLMTPRLSVWARILAIGSPAGGEFILLFVYMAVIYWLIRDFGEAAQAGFGVGYRIMQSIFLPAMAIAFAAPAVGGQNFGARKPKRVRKTFWSAMSMTGVIMIALTLVCQIRPALLVRPFTSDPEVVAIAVGFLRIISWNFVGSGVILACGGMFQALGNTWPGLFSTATRLVTFVMPALWLSRQPQFSLNHIWYLSVATVAAQAVLSYLLLKWQFRRRLAEIPATEAALDKA